MEPIEEFLKRITVNAHSSVRIEAGAKVVYVDPFMLQAEPKDADVVFLTHDHFDHFSPEDVEKVRKPETVFVMPASTAKAAAELLKKHRILTVAPGEKGEVDGLPFETVPAYNPAKPFHPQANHWVGYILTVDGLRVYVAGDTDATLEAAAVHCDVAMLPIGGKYTMDAPEAADLAARIRPAAVIPIHYGSVAGGMDAFDRFCAAADPALRIHRAF